jgi:hypothetical protein
VEAGRLTTNRLGRAGLWAGVTFKSSFVETPAVFASVMTYNGGDAVTTRMRDLDPGGVDLAMDEQENKADGHVNEMLGWLAIGPGSATTTEGRQLDVFFQPLTGVLTPVTYPRTTSHRHPTVVGDVDSANGMDPVFLRYATPTNTEIQLKLTEETSADPETTHVPEDLGVFIGD